MPFSASDLLTILTSLVRQTQVQIIYQGNEITQQVQPDMLEFTYEESLEWEADNMTLQVQDSDGKWSGEWLLDRGQTLQAKIITKNWNSPLETLQMDCGVAEIDEIEVEGPPSTVLIKCCSVPVTSGLKFNKKWVTWTDTTLKAICEKIVKDNKLASLTWEVSKDYPVSRFKQTAESDLHMLGRLCQRFGYSMKLQDNKLVIFDERDYEKKAPVDTIIKGQGGIIKWKITSKSQDIVAGADTAAQDPETGDTTEAHFGVPDQDVPSASKFSGHFEFDNEYIPFEPTDQANPDPAGATALGERPDIRFDTVVPVTAPVSNPLRLRNENPGDGVVAVKQAENLSRLKNKHEHRSEIEFIGDIKKIAGATYMMIGFSKQLDGKWICEKVKHTIGKGGFLTSCGFRRCLVGY